MLSIRTQQKQAHEIARKSHMLWRSVNLCIAELLKNPGHLSREKLAKQIWSYAGPHICGEPTSFSNFRAAAKSVREGTDMFLL